MLFAARPSALDLRRSTSRLASRTAGLVMVLVAVAYLPALAAADDPTWALQVAAPVGACTAYHGVLEVEGSLNWKAREKGAQSAPLSIRGEVTFDERVLAAETTVRRSARYYRQAAVDYRIGSQSNRRQLADHRRLMIASLSTGKTTIASPFEPLSQDELDLVDLPGCTLALGRLLPTATVKLGESWKIDEPALAPLLSLDSVTSSDVQAKLQRVDNEVAFVEFSGAVSGRAEGANTEINIEGKLNVDLRQRAIVWLAMAIREKREIADTHPGLDVTARLRLVAKPLPQGVKELDDSSLPQDALQDDTLAQLVRIVSNEGGFELLCDRQWKIIVDQHNATVLRYFDDGQLIAQAVITPLTDGPLGKHMSLSALEEDVADVLRQHTGQVIDRAEGLSEAGLRVLRISAAGVVSDVSMQWVFYHISSDAGRRAAVTITVQTDLIEKFAERDTAMVETFAFRAPVTTPVSTAAEAANEPTMP